VIVYHGSNRCFRKLRIHKSLVNSSANELNEGLGIYFALDRSTAASYGRYLYTLEINDKYLKDFRRRNVCHAYVNKLVKYIYDKEKINIAKYFNVENLVSGMVEGYLPINGVCREVYLILDSNEKWYFEVPEDKQERIFKILQRYDKDNLTVYLFNYHIKNIGIIKKIDDNIVRIISRERIA